MEAVISNFRQGRHTIYSSEMILKVRNIDKKEKTKPLIGKQVIWISPAKKEIRGKVVSSHGNKGAVRVKFEKGMPGQSVSQKVQIK